MEYKSGDLLARVIGDVETLENFYVRVISPSLTAVLIGSLVAIFFASFFPPIALVLIGFFLILGLILPLLAQLASRSTGTATDPASVQTSNPSSWTGFRASPICSPSDVAPTG